ncbi:hypothetical protein FGO68_gene7956 [Halteria grandinella]|uniref:Uncharacterized protein n=1 Tax=Halteria grandinella TaxID=5974 RepID=A0A8J8P6L8_HALGN|nr:hypothetical protein FGO68_gene7956 [Halteria grandinella]
MMNSMLSPNPSPHFGSNLQYESRLRNISDQTAVDGLPFNTMQQANQAQLPLSSNINPQFQGDPNWGQNQASPQHLRNGSAVILASQAQSPMAAQFTQAPRQSNKTIQHQETLGNLKTPSLQPQINQNLEQYQKQMNMQQPQLANMDEQQMQALYNQLQAQANLSNMQQQPLINSPGLSVDPKGNNGGGGLSSGGNATPVNNMDQSQQQQQQNQQVAVDPVAQLLEELANSTDQISAQQLQQLLLMSGVPEAEVNALLQQAMAQQLQQQQQVMPYQQPDMSSFYPQQQQKQGLQMPGVSRSRMMGNDGLMIDTGSSMQDLSGLKSSIKGRNLGSGLDTAMTDAYMTMNGGTLPYGGGSLQQQKVYLPPLPQAFQPNHQNSMSNSDRLTALIQQQSMLRENRRLGNMGGFAPSRSHMIIPNQNHPLAQGQNHSMKNLQQSAFLNGGPGGSFLPGTKKKKTLKLRDNKYDYFLKAFATQHGTPNAMVEQLPELLANNPNSDIEFLEMQQKRLFMPSTQSRQMVNSLSPLRSNTEEAMLQQMNFNGNPYLNKQPLLGQTSNIPLDQIPKSAPSLNFGFSHPNATNSQLFASKLRAFQEFYQQTNLANNLQLQNYQASSPAQNQQEPSKVDSCEFFLKIPISIGDFQGTNFDFGHAIAQQLTNVIKTVCPRFESQPSGGESKSLLGKNSPTQQPPPQHQKTNSKGASNLVVKAEPNNKMLARLKTNEQPDKQQKLKDYAFKVNQDMLKVRDYKNSVKATRKDVIRGFVNYCLNLALVKKQPPQSNTSLSNKIKAVSMIVPKLTKRPPNKRDIISCFTKFAIATAFTPKDLRPSMRRDIVWSLVSFSLQMYKSKEFRQRVQKERQERRRKMIEQQKKPRASGGKKPPPDKSDFIQKEAKEIRFRMSKFAMKYYYVFQQKKRSSLLIREVSVVEKRKSQIQQQPPPAFIPIMNVQNSMGANNNDRQVDHRKNSSNEYSSESSPLMREISIVDKKRQSNMSSSSPMEKKRTSIIGDGIVSVHERRISQNSSKNNQSPAQQTRPSIVRDVTMVEKRPSQSPKPRPSTKIMTTFAPLPPQVPVQQVSPAFKREVTVMDRLSMSASPPPQPSGGLQREKSILDKRKSQMLPTNQITQGLQREISVIDRKRTSILVASGTQNMGLQREKSIIDKRISSSMAPPVDAPKGNPPLMREKSIIEKQRTSIAGGGGPAFTSQKSFMKGSPAPSQSPGFTSQKSFLMRTVTRNKIKRDGVDELNEDGPVHEQKQSTSGGAFVQPQKLQHQFSRMGTAFLAPHSGSKKKDEEPVGGSNPFNVSQSNDYNQFQQQQTYNFGGGGDQQSNQGSNHSGNYPKQPTPQPPQSMARMTTSIPSGAQSKQAPSFAQNVAVQNAAAAHHPSPQSAFKSTPTAFFKHENTPSIKEDSDDGDSHHHSMLSSQKAPPGDNSSFKSEVQDLSEFNSSRDGQSDRRHGHEEESKREHQAKKPDPPPKPPVTNAGPGFISAMTVMMLGKNDAHSEGTESMRTDQDSPKHKAEEKKTPAPPSKPESNAVSPAKTGEPPKLGFVSAMTIMFLGDNPRGLMETERSNNSLQTDEESINGKHHNHHQKKEDKA